MFVMLTEKNYTKGIEANEIAKYNINYCKKPMFDIVCANLADNLLNQQIIDLTDEQIEKLEKLINK